jgi:phosphate transport system permease protein
MAELSYRAKFFEGKRTYDPVLSHKMSLQLSPAGSAIEEVACAMDDKQLGIAGITADGQIYVHSRKEEPLSGLAEVRAVPGLVKRNWSGNPLQLALDGQLKRLYMGSDDGKIYQWNLVPGQEPDFVASTRVSHVSENPITAFEFLLGGRTLVVGDSSGLITCWFQVRDDIAATGWRLTPIRSFVRHSNEVTMIVPSARGKGFLSSDVRGEIQLHYSTSGRTLAEVSTPVQLSLLRFAPKANGAFSLDHRGTFGLWNIHNPHPEAGVAAFFGKVWYEGYEKPEYVWQSTGGSDEYEPKLSLVPLIFGSLKGTLYALLFAIPLAIFGAIYTSQFMHPRYRSYIKPTVEIMAALPSVVLGFLAGLWLAPRIESILPGLLCTLVLLPLLIVSTGLIWSKLPDGFRGRFGSGSESLLLVPVFCFGIWISFQLSGVLERVLFAGDFRIWLHATLGLAYDQRNALIVGFAMGFAVIPIIYTISEDALSNVPKNLVSGSLALGANRWQTAIRVVLPTAAAGIFSAVMIGLGRAVGETMIVLMATGNTPTMDLNIFNGFRTLSANIAVEIPEAPLGGTLYRVLFLAAMLLFIMTFFVNTAAELIRQKLRERYAKL